MSGVNCTRRKSTPIARANAFASSVLATPGTPSSSTCPPTAVPASSTSTTWSWPTTTLRTSRTTRSRSSFTASSRRPPTRATARPNARTLASSVTGASNAAISSSVHPNDRAAPRDARRRRCCAPSPARAATRARAHRCAGASAPALIVRAFEADRQRLHVLGARGREVAGVRGRADRSGGRATTRTRARRPRRAAARSSSDRESRRARGSRRSRARLRGTRPGGSGRPRARVRTRRCRRVPRYSFSSGDASARKRISPCPTGLVRSAARASSVPTSACAARRSSTTNRCPRPRCRARRRTTDPIAVHDVGAVGLPRRRIVAEVAEIERRLRRRRPSARRSSTNCSSVPRRRR